MFTGIVQALCPVVTIAEAQSLRTLTIGLGDAAVGLETGASVAVNGVCLTVVNVAENLDVSFDVIRETLVTSNLDQVSEGSQVNIERSFRIGDEIGGHILSGHVTCTATLVDIDEAQNERNLRVRVPSQWMKYLHHKGFVALDGASLTIAWQDSEACEFGVCLIPETIARTKLGYCVKGDLINVEIDSQTQAVVDTVERVLQSPQWLARLTSG